MRALTVPGGALARVGDVLERAPARAAAAARATRPPQAGKQPWTALDAPALVYQLRREGTSQGLYIGGVGLITSARVRASALT